MKNYTITVNGTVYEVSVEENDGAVAAPVAAAPKAAAPKKAAPAKAAATGAAGAVKISAPMPGKVLKTPVAAGASVTKGQVILVFEAMKMENEIVAPNDGVVASINVSEGQSFEAGEVVATMN